MLSVLQVAGDADIAYIVLEVVEEVDEKVVRLVSTASRKEVTAHLRDGWYSSTLWLTNMLVLLQKCICFSILRPYT